MHNRMGISDCQAFHYRPMSRPSDVPRPCSYVSPFRLNLAPHQAPCYGNTQPVSQPHEGGSMKKLSFLASLVVLCFPPALFPPALFPPTSTRTDSMCHSPRTPPDMSASSANSASSPNRILSAIFSAIRPLAGLTPKSAC